MILHHHLVRLVRSSWRSLRSKDHEPTSDVATSVGAVGSRPINASRIPQGEETRIDVVCPSARPGRSRRMMTAWVGAGNRELRCHNMAPVTVRPRRPIWRAEIGTGEGGRQGGSTRRRQRRRASCRTYWFPGEIRRRGDMLVDREEKDFLVPTKWDSRFPQLRMTESTNAPRSSVGQAKQLCPWGIVYGLAPPPYIRAN